MRALVVENSVTDPAGRVGEWLTGAGLALEVIRPYDGDPLPAGANGYCALVVLGGEMAAYDDGATPWLPALRALLREAVGVGLPVLAICLGGQLLAEALGGQVEPAADGPELGAALVAKRDAAADDPLFGPIPFMPDVLQWHYDAITALPPNAILLASSPRYPFQAFRVGPRAWGVQFHIETTPELVRQWARDDALAELGVDEDELLARAVAVHADIEEVWRPVVERFAGLAVEYAKPT